MPSPFRLACLILFCLSSLTQAAAPPSDVLEEFDIGTDEGPILVPVTIAGKQYPFLLDTGATHIGYDRSLRHLLGKSLAKRTLNSPAGPVAVEFAMPPKAALGKLPLPADTPAMVDDLRRFSDAMGVRIYGILGLDFLGAHAVRIDFERGRLSFLRRGFARQGRSVPLKRDGGVAYVEADIVGAGPPEVFLIDTACAGFVSVSLNPGVYDVLARLGRVKTTGEIVTETARGRGEERSGRLDRLSIGRFEARGLVAMRGQNYSVLGLHFWARYTTTFDFPARKLYLQKTDRSARADPGGDCSGLAIVARNGRPLIADVAEGSPGDDAGLRKGDEVVSIAGRSTASTNLITIRRLLCVPDRTVKVVVKRGGKTKEVPVRLAEPPGDRKKGE
jgi:predicted aspartyl protease